MDGNKRLSPAGTIALLGVNGRKLTLSNDEAYDLIMEVAAGELDDVPAIVAGSGPRHRSADLQVFGRPHEPKNCAGHVACGCFRCPGRCADHGHGRRRGR